MVKNTIKLGALIVLILVWLPTSPLDLIWMPSVINAIGVQAYTMISIGLIIYLYISIDGKTINEKINNIKREIKSAL